MFGLSESTPYLEFVVSFYSFITVIHLYLDFRQLKALQNIQPPKEVEHLYTKEECVKKASYQQERLRVSMAHSLFDTVINIVCLMRSYYPLTWGRSGDIVSHLGFTGEIAQSVVWALMLSVIGTLLNIPWSVYSTFVIEARHGFNKTTPFVYITDFIKSLFLTVLFVPPIVAGIVYILLHTGPAMALYLWIFMFVLSLLMLTVYPVFIAPLFNKYTPLEEGSLKKSIEELASSLSFPLKKLFVVDGSKRSAHSNAYMYGFFKNRRIVLYDTLIEQCTEEQVTAVLAHELGHWKLGHTIFLFISTQVILGAQLGLFALTRGAPGLYEAFGFIGPQNQPALASLVLFQMMIGPLDEFLGLAQNMVSRLFEFQADAFGVKLGKSKDLMDALCILDKENKGPPNVDSWYSTYHHSHPPLYQRLRAISVAMKKSA